MFIMPSNFSDFFAKSLKTLPYVAVLNGVVFCILGMFLIYSGKEFTTNSEGAKLTVIAVESRTQKGHEVYRPTFEALGTDGKPIQYSGSGWASPKPHEVGDIVDGRVNSTTGELRSNSMIDSSASMGIWFAILGAFSLIPGLVYVFRKRTRT